MDYKEDRCVNTGVPLLRRHCNCATCTETRLKEKEANDDKGKRDSTTPRPSAGSTSQIKHEVGH